MIFLNCFHIFISNIIFLHYLNSPNENQSAILIILSSSYIVFLIITTMSFKFFQIKNCMKYKYLIILFEDSPQNTFWNCRLKNWNHVQLSLLVVFSCCTSISTRVSPTCASELISELVSFSSSSHNVDLELVASVINEWLTSYTI